MQPPPRRSRLFKTRAETKRAQVNWLASSTSTQTHAERCENGGVSENERRWRGEDVSRANKENRLGWRNQSGHHHLQQDRGWCREEQKRSRIFDGKNTLQRSMSSPEFQAELMQVARKVRNKLNCGGRSSAEPAHVASLERRSDADRCAKESKVEEAKRPEKRAARHEEGSSEVRVIEDRIVEERRLIERCNRSGSKLSVYEERKGNARDPTTTRGKDYAAEERQATEAAAGSGGKRRLVEKTATFDESPRAIAAHPRDPSRKDRPAKSRLDALARSTAERFPSEEERRELIEDYQRAKSVAKSRKYDSADPADSGRVRSPESPTTRQSGRDRVADPRGQGSGRESTPERTETREREKESTDRRWRKSDGRNTDGAEERRWPEPVPATEKKDARSKEKHARKPEAAEVREKNWHV